jgi:transcriptional regulator with XRE-family HTH domain
MKKHKCSVSERAEKSPPILAVLLPKLAAMDFPQRLAALRKARDLTQQALADEVHIHVTQLRRYEAGSSQPTLDVLRKLAKALSVSGDALLFEEKERGPSEDLTRIMHEEG